MSLNTSADRVVANVFCEFFSHRSIDVTFNPVASSVSASGSNFAKRYIKNVGRFNSAYLKRHSHSILSYCMVYLTGDATQDLI